MALNLLDLNNDCLFGIFEYLYLEELADIASTCTRFRTIARDVFSHCHKSKGWEIDVEIYNQSEKIFPDLYPLRRRQAAAILRNFGDLITKLKTDFSLDDRQVLNNTLIFNLTSKYCTGELERLELRFCKALQPDKIVDATALFQNLKVLQLDYSTAISESFLTGANQLTLLKLTHFSSPDVNKFLSNDYPQLQSLSLDVPFTDKNDIDIVPFLKRHPNVFDLELVWCKFDFSSIGECQSLRKLSIQYCDCDYMAIAHLENLTTLKLPDNQTILRMLQTSKSSETLEDFQPHQRVFNAKELVATLSRFTNLTRLLFITDGVLDDDLLSDLHRLKKLRVLSIGGLSTSITSDGLVDLVRSLPDLEKLCPDQTYTNECIHLKESTYLRLCDIYRARNKKLVFSNFKPWVYYSGRAREEPFAGDGKRELVQYILGKGNDGRSIVKI